MFPLLGAFSRYLSKSYTAWSPEFALYTNPMRDIQAALFSITGREGIGMTARFLRSYPKAIKEAYAAEVLGKDSPLYAEFKRMGGKTGFWNLQDLAGKVKELEGMMKDLDATATKNPLRMSWKMLKGLESLIVNHAGALENATRFAAYVAMRDAGRSREQAAAFAKNLNVNFNRRGNYTGFLSSFVLFFNPAIQGVHNQYETLFKGKHKAQGWAIWAAFAAGNAALAALNAAGGEDDDGIKWWDKIPDYEKERNLILVLPPYMKDIGTEIKDSTGRYLKLPMPYQWNTGAYLGTMMVDVMRNRENPAEGTSVAKAAMNLARSVLTSYSPVTGIPPTVAPILHHWSNKNSFGDGPLYPEDGWNEHKPDSEKYTARQHDTPWQHWASFVNEATGGNKYEKGWASIPPAVWKNYVRSYVGGPFSFFQGGYDAVVEDDITKAPFIRKMYGEMDERSDNSKYYTETKEPRLALKRYKDADRDNSEIADKMYNDPATRLLIELGEAEEYYRKELGKITKDEIAVKDDPTMKDDKKKVELKKLEQERSTLQEDYLREWRNKLQTEAAKGGK